MPKARRRPAATDVPHQGPGDASPTLPSARTRIGLWVAAVLTIVGGLTVFVLYNPLPRPPVPRVADPSALAPEVLDLIEEMTTAVERGAGAGNDWGRLGMAFEANGLWNQAHDAYRGATLVSPAEARWWYRLAMVQGRTGHPDEALHSLRKAIALSPEYAPAHWRLGLWLLDADDTAGAERAFTRASELNPSDPAGPIGRGRVFLQRREEPRAVEILERTLAGNPGDRYAMQLLGTAYTRLGRHDEAAFALALGVGGEPAWSDPWTDEMTAFRRGFAVRLKDATRHFLDGQTGPAIAILESLQREKPDDTALLSHLGEVYVAARRPEDGIRVLDQVVARDPDRHTAHVSLASAYLQQLKLAEATEAIDRAIALDPTLGRAYETKGLILWRSGNEAGARAMFDRAVHFDPRAVRALVWRGMLELNLSNPSAALASFQQATRLDPVSVDAWLGVANAAMTLGRQEQAAAALTRASQLAPDARAVKEALGRLRSMRP